MAGPAFGSRRPVLLQLCLHSARLVPNEALQPTKPLVYDVPARQGH